MRPDVFSRPSGIRSVAAPVLFMGMILLAGAVGGGLGSHLLSDVYGTGTRTRTRTEPHAHPCRIVSVRFLPSEGNVPGTNPPQKYKSRLDTDPIPTRNPAVSTAARALEDANKQGTPLRIFPDKESYDDVVRHDIVMIVAEVENPQPGDKVFLRAFDADDPTFAVLPVDDEGMEEDNRDDNVPASGRWIFPATGAPGTQMIAVDIVGDKATAWIEVPKQPGDSLKVGAVCDHAEDGPNARKLAATRNWDRNPAGEFDRTLLWEYLGNDRADEPWNNDPADPVKTTSLLTTWRRLHVEVDKMSTQGAENIVYFFEVKAVDSVAGTLSFAPDQLRTPIDDLRPPILDPKRFEKGQILVLWKPKGGGPGTVVYDGPILTNSETTVTLPAAGEVGTVAALAGLPLKDLYGSIVDDDTPRVPPDLGDVRFDLMKSADSVEDNRFAAAYIKPDFEVLKSHNESTPWLLNLKTGPRDFDRTPGGLRSMAWDAKKYRQSKTSELFWSVYILKAFQPERESDMDPHAEIDFAAVTTIREVGPPMVTGLFYELNREVTQYSTSVLQRILANPRREGDHAAAGQALAALGSSPQADESYTVVHELGHHFAPGTKMDTRNVNHDDRSIMGAMIEQTLDPYFSPASIHKMRNVEVVSLTE
jgi:hypothetical protein